MGGQIIGLHDWLTTPAGRYLLSWEQAQFDHTVADIFGYHALQLGLPELAGLQSNRMPHQWLATDQYAVPASGQLPHPSETPPPTQALVTDYSALPFPEGSLDLVLLPHTLELSADPHATLREVHRVLLPEGRVVICCLNPGSLWGFKQRRARLCQRMGFGELFMPHDPDFMAYWRLRDWLRLLGFEVESARFGCYRPALRTDKWLERFAWMDKAGERWWPILGAATFVVATKKVYGMRLLSPPWKARKALATAPVSVANNVQNKNKQGWHERD